MVEDFLYGEYEEIKLSLLLRKKMLEDEMECLRMKMDSEKDSVNLNKFYQQQKKNYIEVLLCDRILCKLLSC